MPVWRQQCEELPGAGNAGINELARQHAAAVFRQHQHRVLELRTLRFMHGHGKRGIDVAQPRGQHAAHGVAFGKIHAQGAGPGRVGQGQADVAVEHAGAVVVAGDHDRPSDVPFAAAAQQPGRLQALFDGLVQAGDAPLAVAHGAQDAEGLERFQHGLHPCQMVAGIVADRPLPDQPQVIAVAAGSAVAAGQRQLQQVGWQRRIGPRHFFRFARTQDAHRARRITAVDGQRQRADRTAEAATFAQHHGLLGDRTGTPRILFRQLLAGTRLYIRQGFRIVAAGLGVMAQVAQHGARLHRRQLILVAKQDQGGGGRQRRQQRGHHFQVNHRRFIDDQHIDVELVAGMVTEGARIGPRAEQAVQSTGGAQFALRHHCPHAVVQAGQRHVDRLFQACRRLAGGRGQRHPQTRLLAAAGGKQQRQQARHRVRLAGAGTAGDDAQLAAHGHRAGGLLPVHAIRVGAWCEQDVEPVAHRPGLVVGVAGDQAAQRPGAHRVRHLGFIAPVAAQVQPLAVEHQRLLEIEVAHRPYLFAPGQQCAPGGDILRPRPGGGHRRPQRGPFFGIEPQQRRRVASEFGQHQAAVAAPFQFGQQHAGDHQWRRGAADRGDEAGKSAAQAPQPAVFGQRIDCGQ